jgi:hypothetical protein
MNSIFFSFSQNEIKLAQRQSQFCCKNAKNKKILEMAEVWTLSGGKEKRLNYFCNISWWKNKHFDQLYSETL